MGKLTKLQRAIREFLENVELDRAGDLDAYAVKIEELVDEIVQSNLPDFDGFLDAADSSQVRDFMEQNDLVQGDDVAELVEKALDDEFVKKDDLVDIFQEAELADQDDIEDIQKVVDERTKHYLVLSRGFFGRLKWLLTGR